jgi:DNA-binding NarL/FixJ family response regulator
MVDLPPSLPAELWAALARAELTVVDDFVLDGRRYLRVRPTRRDSGLQRRLSRRETQVLEAVARGHANKHIAFDLGVSESTVSAYVRRVSRKLCATSRVGLVRAYRRLGAPAVVSPRAA